jgi:hypothetical protein
MLGFSQSKQQDISKPVIRFHQLGKIQSVSPSEGSHGTV